MGQHDRANGFGICLQRFLVVGVIQQLDDRKANARAAAPGAVLEMVRPPVLSLIGEDRQADTARLYN